MRSRRRCSRRTSARPRQLRDEGVTGAVHVVGDVMADAARLFGPLARERSRILDRLGLEPGGYVLATVHREANVRPERLRRIVAGLTRSTRPLVFPAHPRTRRVVERESFRRPGRELIEPLGYLDFAALASQAAAIATDSGGLQKEAYWYGVPCVTMRPSTEWVDTVEAGANTLVDDDPDANRRGSRGGARARPTRPPLYGDGHASGGSRRSVRFARRGAGPCICDVAIVGAGYVGVPLARPSPRPGSACCSSTSMPSVVERSTAARATSRTSLRDARAARRAGPDRARRPTTTQLREADAILIALPTPLTAQREPDLSLRRARRRAASRACSSAGQLVVLESTTYPGTTREIVQPILEQGQRPEGRRGLPPRHVARARRPGPRPTGRRRRRRRSSAGSTPACTEAAAALYRGAIDTVHKVSTPEAAELTKLLENIFRSVNIALVNELAQLCDRMDIDVWEVVDAAATKPFGFMSFQPGPGPRRPLHPDRPLLPLVEGARVRLLDALHRARRRGQQQHAVLLPLA